MEPLHRTGPRRGARRRRARQLPVATVAWSDWRDAHPDGLVLSRDTGHDPDYGRNPYPGYDDIDNPPFLFDGEVDERLAAKTRIVGVGLDSAAAGPGHSPEDLGFLQIGGGGGI